MSSRHFGRLLKRIESSQVYCTCYNRGRPICKVVAHIIDGINTGIWPKLV